MYEYNMYSEHVEWSLGALNTKYYHLIFEFHFAPEPYFTVLILSVLTGKMRMMIISSDSCSAYSLRYCYKELSAVSGTL